MSPELNSLADVQTKLKIGRSKVFELIKSGELRSVTIGRRRYVTSAAIEEFVRVLDAAASAPKGAA